MRRNRIPLVGTSLLLALGAGSLANATVTQVDGSIIPVGDNLQDALDGQGEGLDAVRNAAELPEVFLPNSTEPVVFTNVAEGASFENTFGWYNIGDDITSEVGRRRNLHPILGCGSSMENHAFDPTHDNHHHGNPTFYVQNAEPGAVVSVDFAAEQSAGRYKGGFIAFYLITPEQRGTDGQRGGSCGDVVEDGSAYFDFIYFTQKDLNNDGDFVHHLVYNSNRAADRFYFGFEDRFRGGDNDFEDMLIRVDGLTPPCVPSAEVCDGRDNDCDGQVDADDPDLVGVTQPCVCDGLDLDCTAGPVAGVCQTGQTVCVAGAIQCEPTVSPSPETCDGLDNDCDGLVDDSPAGVGTPCDGADADLCEEGQTVCVGGQISCGDNTGPNLEICNGDDDDCDSTVDEDLTDTGDACGTDIGVCTPGVEVCVNGELQCQGASTGSAELCDGLDNDCDTNVDEDPGDANGPCGPPAQGECQPGVAICSGGSLVCVGGAGPTPELCDTLDNDCDGSVDEDAVDVGAPCNAPGLCSPGAIVCTPAGPSCQGGTPGTPELCNGIDDDCNGTIDDNPGDVGGPCGGGGGTCAAGNFQCVNGAIECVGGADGTTETCNGIDDDCDGSVDEGDLCEGGECQSGQCASPCSEGEFPCSPGLVCVNDFCVTDPCFDIDCPDGDNGERFVCEEGACLPVCDTVPACPGERVCRPTDGMCVPNNCHYLPLCEDGELCRDAACVTDLCADTSCPDDQLCRDGACVASCAGVSCEPGQVCRDGVCAASGCPEGCPNNQVCDGSECILNPCVGRLCPNGQTCHPQTGECVSDPCIGVVCPQDQVCRFGDCFAQSTEPPPKQDRVTAAGGGCSVTGGQGGQNGGQSGGWLWMTLAVLGLIAGRRAGPQAVLRHGLRRALRRALRAGLLASLVTVLATTMGACSVNPYCLNCETDSDGGSGGGDIDAGPPDMRDGGGSGGQDGGGSSSCDIGVGRPEECNGVDDDCDDQVDEDFDLSSDVLHCGACGADCLLDGARTACEQSQCAFVGCFPGHVDVDQDTAGAFGDSNGCEYECFQSNGGVEACDRLDNDCDGSVDEGLDLSTNENCGACGVLCSRFQANASCETGTCLFDPATDCNPGFHDINENPDDGCEYACAPSNGGVEICDLRDNDCNGTADDGVDLQGDVNNCGACGRVCNTLNATPSCVDGACTFDPATDCAPGFHDANGNPIDGCEYACTPSNGGVEICDRLDNDCDARVDDAPVDAGGACNVAPGGVPAGVCTNTGTLVCSLGTLVCTNAPGPQIEVCDNLDNDCDGSVDEGVVRTCYSGPAGTAGVGACITGLEQCVGGSFTGVCVNEVTPAAAEDCNSVDDDCDGQTDEAAGGGLITQVCYSGSDGTAGVGTCTTGIQTCNFGAFGVCEGEVVDAPTDICGDSLDTDCDGDGDGAEGCLVIEPGELRLDEGNAGDPLGTVAGAQHSFDLSLAAGGSPLGSRIYAVWADLRGGTSEIYMRRSLDGGITWENLQNLTEALNRAAVKPLVVVAPGAASDRVYVVYQSVRDGVRDILVQGSSNSGASFSELGGGRLDGGADEDSFHHHAAVSADGNTLAVVWESLDPATLGRDIRSRVSTNAGGSFTAARQINVGSGSNPVAGRPQVGITDSGRFVYVWREARGGATTDIFAASSDTAGGAIDPASELRLDGDGDDTRNSDFPQLVTAGNNIYVTWQDISTQPSGGSDVVFARSTNSGSSYGSEQVIDDPGLEVSASFTPVIAVDPRGAGGSDDRVYITWEDRRLGTQIFAAASSNAGASFAAAVRVSSANGEPITGVTRSPRIAHAGGDAVVIAYINDLGAGVESIFTSTSADAGLSWQVSHDRVNLGAGQALQPAVVRAAGGLVSGAVVSWIDFRADTGINGDPYARRTGL